MEMPQVLYVRHGYRRSQQHGEPRECQINTVLEYGEGSPVAMGILYQEVCQRVGLPVAGMPLEDDCGQYYVLWPTKFPLKVLQHAHENIQLCLHGHVHLAPCDV